MSTYYVASKFENKPGVKFIMDELRKRGEQVIGDWTSHSVEGIADAKTRRNMLVAFAEEDRHAAQEADVLLLLHHDHCRGAFTELGIAIGYRRYSGRDKRIVVIGGAHAAPDLGPIFYFLPEVEHFSTVEEFFADLDKRLSKGWRR